MQPVPVVCAYIAAVFLGGALIAPWLYWAAQMGASVWAPLELIAANPFHRFVNRAMLVIALAGLWPLLRSLSLAQRTREGLMWNRNSRRELAFGLALGFVSLGVVALVAIALGGRSLQLQHSQSDVFRHLINATIAAAVVSVLEEILFRGGFLNAFRKELPLAGAVILSSAIYALVHFFERAASPKVVEWHSGIVILGRMLGGFAEFEKLIPGFVNLTLSGAVLATAYIRSGSLYLPIGLHAGWIFWLKSYGFLTTATGESNWLLGTGKLIDGWIALPFLVGLLLLMYRPPHRASQSEEPVPIPVRTLEG